MRSQRKWRNFSTSSDRVKPVRLLGLLFFLQSWLEEHILVTGQSVQPIPEETRSSVEAGIAARSLLMYRASPGFFHRGFVASLKEGY